MAGSWNRKITLKKNNTNEIIYYKSESKDALKIEYIPLEDLYELTLENMEEDFSRERFTRKKFKKIYKHFNKIKKTNNSQNKKMSVKSVDGRVFSVGPVGLFDCLEMRLDHATLKLNTDALQKTKNLFNRFWLG